MNRHNIARSEAFDSRPRVAVHTLPARRRPARLMGVPLWTWAVTGWAGLIVSVDFHIGLPVFLLLTLAGFALAYFWRLAA